MKKLEKQIEKEAKMKSFQIEERVYFQTNNIQMKIKNKKLNHKSIESFMIVRDIKKLNYKLDLFKEI